MRPLRHRRRRLPALHINRMIPNVLTLLALAAGLSAIRFALLERWEHAVLAVLVAAILDGLDGRIARILKGASRFGAELDSLSDFLCFGVAPGLILYLWSLQDAGRIGWALVLLLCICCSLRLARFNTDLDVEERPVLSRSFFVGVPSPAGAGLVLLPMALWFQSDLELFRHPALVGVIVLVTSLLLVSRVRTYTFKRIRIEQRTILPAMLGVALFLALLASAPWLTLTLTLAGYIASIPLSMRDYQRDRLRSEALAAAPEGSSPGVPPAKGR